MIKPMINHFTAHKTPFPVPEHKPSVYGTYLRCITLSLAWTGQCGMARETAMMPCQLT